MSKKRYRFYGGMLSAQEKWLNKMAAKGQRLIRTKKLLYEFEACHPGQYQYRIEFVGHKSKTNAADYRAFLEEMGYKVFDKNINLNYSVGKARFRPWADQGGLPRTQRRSTESCSLWKKKTTIRLLNFTPLLRTGQITMAACAIRGFSCFFYAACLE